MAITDTPTVIVGGGPAGYAAALLLASRGWTRVTLVERSPNPCAVDPGRQFSYLLSYHGLRFIDELPKLAKRLEKEGVSIIPPSMTLLAPGKEPTKKTFDTGEKRMPSYWVRRSNLLRMMSEYLEEEYPGRVEVLVGTECTSVSFSASTALSKAPIQVRVKGVDDEEQILEAELVLGCDGVRSVVREALYEDEKKEEPTVSSRRGFGVDVWTSPSVGLRYKSLMLPPKPVLVKDPELVAEPDGMYVFRGKTNKRSADRLFNMGMLPVGVDVSQGRTGTIVRRPSHDLWKIKTAEEAYDMFEENFPHVAVRDLITPEEMARFAASEPGAFPPIQRSCSLVGTLNAGKAGVVLLGDAAHCFPPDLGQGVNTSLEDVKLLVDELHKEGATIQSALQEYSEMRDKDISALMRLMEIGFPYQYGQKKSGIILWAINQVLRKSLHKMVPSYFSPQIFSMMAMPIQYSEILKRANDTTRRIWLLVATFILVPCFSYLLSRLSQ
eukprot:Plantae.Rhodophyta-Hildenbrandia_rubra.ctg23094.p1 GENE.Plantae.Rhodophyta-Hildenbrandia_rubra.ctg23094~~Plantae.Rhodophyta-Hildenbrandia_rubra.ctg23094.p1  ORF type:complete len:496 (+),score=68.30 Plantae.Rhodophyta-Hildenbrandia_rubra.ctg23094:181-1668(+)